MFRTLTKTSLPEFLPTMLPAMVIKDRRLQINKPTEMRGAFLLERMAKFLTKQVSERMSG